jgi:hypothetical protein
MAEDEMTQDKSAPMIDETQLDVEEETPQKIDAEIGQDGSKTRRRALLCIGIMVILVAIILGVVLGMRDTSTGTISVPTTTAPTISSAPSETPSLTPTVTPLNNSICEGAQPLDVGDAAIVATLANAIEQDVVFCEVPVPFSASQPGFWYKVRKGMKERVISCLSLIVRLTISQLLPICSTLGKASLSLPKQVLASIFMCIQHVIKLPALLPTLFMETPRYCQVIQSHGRQQAESSICYSLPWNYFQVQVSSLSLSYRLSRITTCAITPLDQSLQG